MVTKSNQKRDEKQSVSSFETNKSLFEKLIKVASTMQSKKKTKNKKSAINEKNDEK